jgi:hypothetical protein
MSVGWRSGPAGLEVGGKTKESVVSGPLQEKYSAWGMSPLGTRKYQLPAAICQLNLYALCPMPYASFSWQRGVLILAWFLLVVSDSFALKYEQVKFRE